MTYMKKALQLSYELDDQQSELYYYEKLGAIYMNAGYPRLMI